MQQFLEQLASVNDAVNTFVWVRLGLWILIGTGILMTVLTGFFQITHLGHWWKNTIGSLLKKDVISHTGEKSSISPFQALCTACTRASGCWGRRRWGSGR